MVPITGSYNLLPISESTNKSRKFIFNLRCAEWFTTNRVPLLNNELIQSHIDVCLQSLLNALFSNPGELDSTHYGVPLIPSPINVVRVNISSPSAPL